MMANKEIIKYDKKGRRTYYSDGCGYNLYAVYDNDNNQLVHYTEKYNKVRYWIIWGKMESQFI